jgi:hypothetical protein
MGLFGVKIFYRDLAIFVYEYSVSISKGHFVKA